MAKQYVPVEYQASIAWFKLAELVTRGERERAFTIYRLLIHALHDDAYAAQLKGDLWYAFNEYDRAREAYYSAIAWYDFSERPYQSAFLYQRLAIIEYNSLPLRLAMITRFAELSLKEQVTRYINELFVLAEQQSQQEFCVSSLNEAHCSPTAYEMIQNACGEFHIHSAYGNASTPAENHLSL